MIESGSNTPGVRARDFGLPPGTALRYEQPHPDLRALLPSYVVLDSQADSEIGKGEWILPGWAQIWFVTDAAPVAVNMRRRRYAPLAATVLYGVTSRAVSVTSNGGLSIGIDVSPLGWARFIRTPADKLADRVTPLSDVLPAPLVRDLVESLGRITRVTDVQATLDAAFLRHLPPPHRDEPVIACMMEWIAQVETMDVAAMATDTGVDVRVLRRIAKRHFGFPPKVSMMRRRFLARLVDAMVPETGARTVPAAGSAYYDESHYLRDAARFLGMTPRRFLSLGTPFLRAGLRARRRVIGASTPTLD